MVVIGNEAPPQPAAYVPPQGVVGGEHTPPPTPPSEITGTALAAPEQSDDLPPDSGIFGGMETKVQPRVKAQTVGDIGHVALRGIGGRYIQ